MSRVVGSFISQRTGYPVKRFVYSVHSLVDVGYWSSLRSRPKKERAGSFFLAPTTSKRLLRRLILE